MKRRPGSFTGLFQASVACSDFAADTEDAAARTASERARAEGGCIDGVPIILLRSGRKSSILPARWRRLHDGLPHAAAGVL